LNKTGVLLVNLGTPKSAQINDVRTYLHEFLLDPRVITEPKWKREFLVRFLIVPKRIKQTSKSYEAIWTERGSPLLFWGEKVLEKLKSLLGDSYKLKLAMRYQFPSIKEELNDLKDCSRLIILPLFPQYASATTGSIVSAIMQELSSWHTFPDLQVISSYPEDPKMIEAFAERARAMKYQDYDKVIFSFHGLPVSHLRKNAPKCYLKECLATADAIQNALKLPKETCHVTFQSRLGKEPWLEPSTQETIINMAKSGIKKILVFSPSFVADCLETIYEIGVELKEEFGHFGGEKLDLVPSLNDHPLWIEALQDLVKNRP